MPGRVLQGKIPRGAQEPVGVRKTPQQRSCSGVIADLSGRYEELDRPPGCVGYGVQLGVHAALRASDQASTPPFFDHRLEAVRCAFRYVASMEIVLLSGASAAKPVMIRANTPISLHRFQRL